MNILLVIQNSINELTTVIVGDDEGQIQVQLTEEEDMQLSELILGICRRVRDSD